MAESARDRVPGEVDLLIRGGVVLTLDAQESVFDPGFVAVREGRIAGAGPAPEAARFSAGSTLDASGCLVMPGLINGHTHAAMTLFRGMADDLPLMTWLTDHIFPAEARLTPKMVYWGSMLAVAEMLAAGITAFADGYFFEGEVARAAGEAGMRAIVGQGVIDFPAPGVPDPERNVEHARDFLGEWTGASGLITPAIFCHTPHTCSEKTLAGAKDAARDFSAPFLIHLAETAWEVEEVLKSRGKSPGRLLKDLGILDGSTHLVHCIYLDPEEIELISAAGSAVIHCPESNMKLASGLARVGEMLGKGVRIALGTDGAASNNDLDILAEMRTAQALAELTWEDALASATWGAAAALGFGPDLGRLEEGCHADLMVADLGAPRLAPRRDPGRTAASFLRRGDVRDVVVAGRVLVRNKEHTTIDLPRVLSEVNSIKDKHFS